MSDTAPIQVPPALVAQLRKQTGQPMLMCKRALVEGQLDIEKAIIYLRKQGLASAQKKSGRQANEGKILVHLSDNDQKVVMIEVKCETDFVSKNQEFQDMVARLAKVVADKGHPGLTQAQWLALPFDDATVEDFRQHAVSKMGENIQFGRVHVAQAEQGLSTYHHGDKIAVIIELEKSDQGLGRDIAMHVAAMKPSAIDESSVDESLLATERAIYQDQAAKSGKPADITEKIVDGKMQKFLKSITLINQPFVKNPDQTIAELLASSGNRVLSMTRFELGEDT